jgi:hypothetical protein
VKTGDVEFDHLLTEEILGVLSFKACACRLWELGSEDQFALAFFGVD